MKSNETIILKIALFFLFLFAVVNTRNASAAIAYPDIKISVSTEDESAQAYVKLYEYGDTTTFFLPSYMKDQKLIITFPDKMKVKLNGETIVSGTEIDPERGVRYKLTYSGKEHKLTFLQSENISAVFIDTESGKVDYIHKSKLNKEKATILMIEPDGSVSQNAPLEYIKGRGASSFSQPKKPYQIKFENRTSMYGLASAKKWIFLANHKDLSLARDHIVYRAAAWLGADYAPGDGFADVYLNGCYYGSYQICEKVEIDKNRISERDLQKATEEVNDAPLNSYKRFGSSKPNRGTSKGYEIPNNPDDITGAYLLELEKEFHYPEETSGFVTQHGQPIIIKSPEYASKEQVSYISDYIQHFENAIFAADGIDPETGKYYTEFMDMDSMVREYLLEEVFKNYDVNKSSQFIVKPSDEDGRTAYFGPVWDFDLSMGDWCDNSGNSHIASPKKLFAASQSSGGHYWLPKLCEHQDFHDRVVEMYYEELVPYLNALLGIEENDEVDSLTEMESLLTPSANMNFVRWPVMNSNQRPVDTGSTFRDNYAYLENWLIKRMEYLDSIWLQDYQNLKNR